MKHKPRLTVRPSRHGYCAQVTRDGDRWFSIAQEAPTRAAAEALAHRLAAEAIAAADDRSRKSPCDLAEMQERRG